VDCRTWLEGAAYFAQLYFTADAGSLAPVGQTSIFGTGVGAGYFFPFLGIVTLPDIHETPVFVEVRAGEAAAAGPTYEAAVASGGKHGRSNVISVMPSVPPGAPAPLKGLQSFCLIPEPTCGALLGVGGAVWWLGVRRREA
jgi:hypothetical protein